MAVLMMKNRIANHTTYWCIIPVKEEWTPFRPTWARWFTSIFEEESAGCAAINGFVIFMTKYPSLYGTKSHRKLGRFRDLR
ncbi:hypothetical protein T4E_11851 [Trichinella pseudospiralis]|nr:hypothetical protein T4E_11851 [Trichinella pseudospiralis]